MGYCQVRIPLSQPISKTDFPDSWQAAIRCLSCALSGSREYLALFSFVIPLLNFPSITGIHKEIRLFNQIAQDGVQNPTVAIIIDFHIGIQQGLCLENDFFAIGLSRYY